MSNLLMDYFQSFSILLTVRISFTTSLVIYTKDGSCTTCLFYVNPSKIASFIILPFRKRMQRYSLFLNYKNFSRIFFKKIVKITRNGLEMSTKKYVL